MKVLFVADNRVRVNLGCRATSAALSMLISKKHSITGRITGNLTLSPPPPIADDLTLSLDLEKNISMIKKLAEVDARYRELDLDTYDYDALVLNAEGTMIMSAKPRIDTRYYLTFSYWAKKTGKKVFFVNGMFSDSPASNSNRATLKVTNEVLSSCDFVTARDPLSLRYALENMPDVDCVYIPDALFTWKNFVERDIPEDFRFFMPFKSESDESMKGLSTKNGYVLVSGGSWTAWNKEKALGAFVPLIEKLKQTIDLPVILFSACNGDGFLAKVAKAANTYYIPAGIPIIAALNLLAHATVYISGRYHPSIMASLGHVPCIFLWGNSHKNLGLQEMLGYQQPKQFSPYPSAEEINEICQTAVKYVEGTLLNPITYSIDRLAAEAATLTHYIK